MVFLRKEHEHRFHLHRHDAEPQQRDTLPAAFGQNPADVDFGGQGRGARLPVATMVRRGRRIYGYSANAMPAQVPSGNNVRHLSCELDLDHAGPDAVQNGGIVERRDVLQ